MNTTFLLGAAESGVAWGDFIFYIFTFLILLALVKKYAWGPVTEMMEKRSQKISDDIDSAEKARQDAEDLLAKREAALKNSRVEASEIIDRAKKNGEQQKANIISSAQDEVQTLKSNAKKDIQQERQEALDSVKNDVAELSIEIATKIIRKELTSKDQKALVDSYIEGLGKQNETR
ncbi:ATP synthase F0, B subunit [Ligilactobacillus hayakitensis DSM 18933 = JCM 14209]|uniref:ATP synthase subunit b n=1 Tax=Ligilactobacillus hayakitensis DSM 18933 = JCM 14209 TaxID=1423755 RepID=A0A0R1WSX5_9LACO|nr:F0F1 ATP synthase subunit B [Ligilactobacillus hayakitensis]KRM18841.1 ATP synthase F0, B subunit [Ligilactobacillus hayakitensis DSM 18933 = JCM 14209]